MSSDRKNLWLCIGMVIFAIIMGGLTWFLKFMGFEFGIGFACGVIIAFGLAGILVKDFRNLS